MEVDYMDVATMVAINNLNMVTVIWQAGMIT